MYKTWVLNRRLSLLLWNVAMPRLDHAIRNNVTGRLQDGLSQSEVARQFNVEQSTITRLWKRLNQTGLAQDRHRNGRPRITTPSKDRYIWVFHLRNRTVTAAGIPGLRRISTHTVWNRFRLRGIRPRRIYVGPVWTPALRRAHVRWCHILKVWTGAVFGSAMNHGFFSKDVMDEPAYTGVEMSVSSMSLYRKLRYLAVEASWCGQQYHSTANKRSACPRKFNVSTLLCSHICTLSLTDRGTGQYPAP